MSNRKGMRYTGDVAFNRYKQSELRSRHKESIREGSIEENLPEPLVPSLFSDIEKIYWKSLQSVKDPRDPSLLVYPLDLILHRIISGLIDGTSHIGVLFPKKQRSAENEVQRQLGVLPTRPAVYALLRRINWDEANVVLAPLWERLGYTPELVVKRKFRDPKVILEEFREEQKQEESANRQQQKRERESRERSEGMSAAAAKRSKGGKAQSKSKRKNRPVKTQAVNESRNSKSNCAEMIPVKPKKEREDLLLDGKVVKASYNMEVKERFVHVTNTKVDEQKARHRYILGAKETKFDRNGEWGAALSILDALRPLPKHLDILVSGDAGFCVHQFCKWLAVVGFFIFFESNKTQETFLIG